MGIKLNAVKSPEQPYIKAAGTYIYQSFWRGVSPLFVNDFIWWVTGNQRKSQDALKILKSMTSSVIKERMKILQESQEEVKRRPDFLDLLLESNKQGEMSFKQVHEEVDTFLFGISFDTTAHTIIWTLWCLATHPKYQDQVHEELIDHFGDSDSDFSTNKIKDLKLLDSIIKESLRIFPPVPLIERRLRNEIKIGKFTLPKRATIVIPMFIIHHNSRVFPNHWEFQPENFMNEEEYPSNAFIPFSVGLRNCIGQKFAMREIKIVLAHLIYNFKFSTKRQFRDNKPGIELVLVPSLGLPLQIQRRN